MKLKNKIIIIFLSLIILFFINENKGYCASGDFNSIPNFQLLHGLYFNDIKSYLDSNYIENYYDNYFYHIVFTYPFSSNNGYVLISSDSPIVYKSEGHNQGFYIYNVDSVSLIYGNGDSSESGIVRTFNDVSSFYINNNAYVEDSNFIYSNHDILNSSTNELVFREAGTGENSGESGGGEFELINPYGDYEFDNEDNDIDDYLGYDEEDDSGTSWFSGIIRFLTTPFRLIIKGIKIILNFLGNLVKKFLAGLFDFVKLIVIPEDGWFEGQINNIKDDVDSHFHYRQYISDLESIKGYANSYDSNSSVTTYVNLPDYKIADNLTLKMNRFIDFSFIGEHRVTWFNWIRVIIYPGILFFNINSLSKLLLGHSIADGNSREAKGDDNK